MFRIGEKRGAYYHGEEPPSKRQRVEGPEQAFEPIDLGKDSNEVTSASSQLLSPFIQISSSANSDILVSSVKKIVDQAPINDPLYSFFSDFLRLEHENPMLTAIIRHLYLAWFFSQEIGLLKPDYKKALEFISEALMLSLEVPLSEEVSRLIREAKGLSARTQVNQYLTEGGDSHEREAIGATLFDGLVEGSELAAKTILELIEKGWGEAFGIIQYKERAQALYPSQAPFDFIAFLKNFSPKSTHFIIKEELLRQSLPSVAFNSVREFQHELNKRCVELKASNCLEEEKKIRDVGNEYMRDKVLKREWDLPVTWPSPDESIHFPEIDDERVSQPATSVLTNQAAQSTSELNSKDLPLFTLIKMPSIAHRGVKDKLKALIGCKEDQLEDQALFNQFIEKKLQSVEITDASKKTILSFVKKHINYMIKTNKWKKPPDLEKPEPKNTWTWSSHY